MSDILSYVFVSAFSMVDSDLRHHSLRVRIWSRWQLPKCLFAWHETFWLRKRVEGIVPNDAAVACGEKSWDVVRSRGCDDPTPSTAKIYRKCKRRHKSPQSQLACMSERTLTASLKYLPSPIFVPPSVSLSSFQQTFSSSSYLGWCKIGTVDD